MTITAQWLQASTYPAAADRGLISALTAKSAAAECRDGVYGTTELVPSAPGGGMLVEIGPGTANVGSYVVTSTETETVSLDVGSGGIRTDLIVLRVYDEEAGDGSSEAAIEVVKGVSATEPALPERSIRIAAVSVSSSATTIGPENVTDRRQFTAGAGGLIHLPGALASSPAVPDGQAIWDPTAGRIGVNAGGTWKQFADISALIGPTVTSGLDWSMVSGVATMLGYSVTKRAGIVSILARVRYDSSTPLVSNAQGDLTNTQLLTIPAPYQMLAAGGFLANFWCDNATGEAAIALGIGTAGQLLITRCTVPSSTVVSKNDELRIGLVYPAATP